MKKQVDIGSKVKFNSLPDADIYEVVGKHGFTIEVVPDTPIPSGYSKHASQYIDVSLAIPV